MEHKWVDEIKFEDGIQLMEVTYTNNRKGRTAYIKVGDGIKIIPSAARLSVPRIIKRAERLYKILKQQQDDKTRIKP